MGCGMSLSIAEQAADREYQDRMMVVLEEIEQHYWDEICMQNDTRPY